MLKNRPPRGTLEPLGQLPRYETPPGNMRDKLKQSKLREESNENYSTIPEKMS